MGLTGLTHVAMVTVRTHVALTEWPHIALIARLNAALIARWTYAPLVIR